MARFLMRNIRHTGIVVTDMEQSLSFYRDVMKLKPVIDFDEKGPFIDTLTKTEGIHVRMVKLEAEDGGMIELLQYFSHPERRLPGNKLHEIGPTHVAFTVEDVDAIYADWSARGVPCNSAPQISPDGKAKLFFCQDPDGTFLEIVEMLE